MNVARAGSQKGGFSLEAPEKARMLHTKHHAHGARGGWAMTAAIYGSHSFAQGFLRKPENRRAGPAKMKAQEAPEKVRVLHTEHIMGRVGGGPEL